MTVTFYPDPHASLPTSDASPRRTALPRWSLSQMLAVGTRVLAPVQHHLHLTLSLTYEYLRPHYMHTFGATTTRSDTTPNTLYCTYTPPGWQSAMVLAAPTQQLPSQDRLLYTPRQLRQQANVVLQT